MSGNILIASLVSLAYFGWMRLFFPYWNMFWIISDEGFTVMKAFLVLRGHRLYSEIWSDQPPLFTYILAGLFKYVSLNIDISRMLILILSCMLVWAVFIAMASIWNRTAAFIGALFLVLLPSFTILSAAVLVGQPALVFAGLSLLTLLLWHKSSLPGWLVVSGVLLAISASTKLFTGLLAPVFLLGIILSQVLQNGNFTLTPWRRNLRPAIIWLSALGVTAVLVVLLLVGPADLGQLIQPHLSAAQSAHQLPGDDDIGINALLMGSWMYLPSLLAGLGFLVQKRTRLAYYPLGWAAAAYILLLFHQPVWWHHQLLVTIPASMLAAAGAAQSLGAIWQAPGHIPAGARLRILVVLGVFGLGLILFTRIPELVSMSTQRVADDAAGPRPAAEDRVMKKISQFAGQTTWMVTDLPMFAFRAGLPVPPDLAVISWKRFASGNITEMQILADIRQYRPEQVLIGRFDLPAVLDYLDNDYRVVYERDMLKLFVLNSIR